MTKTSLLLTLWELPQLLLGRMIAKKTGAHAHTVDGVRIYVTDKYDGMSMGDTLFVNPNSFYGTWMVKHEFGHIIQSRMLGWFFIPLVLIPSILCKKATEAIDKAFPSSEADVNFFGQQFYTEQWANWLIL